MSSTTSAQTWRHFPRYMIAAMLVVVAVNVRFIVLAVATFPGAASSDDFDTSNNYNKVLANVAAQNALGWNEQASATDGRAVIDLTGPHHTPLAGAALIAQAQRPIGTDTPITLSFQESPPGHFTATTALPAPGQWDLMLHLSQGGHQVRVTRRVLAK